MLDRQQNARKHIIIVGHRCSATLSVNTAIRTAAYVHEHLHIFLLAAFRESIRPCQRGPYPASYYGSGLKVKQPYIVTMHIPPKACLNFKSLDLTVSYKRRETLKVSVKKTSTLFLCCLNVLLKRCRISFSSASMHLGPDCANQTLTSQAKLRNLLSLIHSVREARNLIQ